MKISREEVGQLEQLGEAAFRYLSPNVGGIDGGHTDVLERVTTALRRGDTVEPSANAGVALLCVDVQHDFLHGSLIVPDGTDVIDALLDEQARGAYAVVVASRDLHPSDHQSFASRAEAVRVPAGHAEWKYRWPDHCVTGTKGAEIDPAILEIADVIVNKGTQPDSEAYSAFDGWIDNSLTDSDTPNALVNPPLVKYLRAHNITHLIVGGLATDYCVRATVLDAIRYGFDVAVLLDACRGIDPEDSERALAEMVEAGANMTRTATMRARA